MQEQRYTLTLPTELYQELTTLADRRGMTIKELVRQFMKLGLLVAKFEETPNTGLFLKEQQNGSEGTRETRLLLM